MLILSILEMISIYVTIYQHLLLKSEMLKPYTVMIVLYAGRFA